MPPKDKKPPNVQSKGFAFENVRLLTRGRAWRESVVFALVRYKSEEDQDGEIIYVGNDLSDEFVEARKDPNVICQTMNVIELPTFGLEEDEIESLKDSLKTLGITPAELKTLDEHYIYIALKDDMKRFMNWFNDPSNPDMNAPIIGKH